MSSNSGIGIGLRAFWMFLLLTAVCPTAVRAAPAELYNKTIIVTFSETRVVKFTTGTDTTIRFENDIGIYISSAGRIFSRQGLTHMGTAGRRARAASLTDRDPTGGVKGGGAGRVGTGFRFVGRSLVSRTQYDSGAVQITISFDQGYQSCSVSILRGKEEGAPGVVMSGGGRRLRMITGGGFGGMSCSIRNGNLLGG